MTKAYEAGFVDTMRKFAQDASLTSQLTGVNGSDIGRTLLTSQLTGVNGSDIGRTLAGYLGLAAAGAGAGALLSEKGKRGKGALKGALIASLLGAAGQSSKRMRGKLDEQNSRIQALEEQLKPIVDQEAKRKADIQAVTTGR